MNDKNKNLAIRIATALVALPVVLYVTWAMPRGTAVMLGITSAVCAAEYYGITLKRLTPAAWVGIAGGLLLPMLPLLVGQGQPVRVAYAQVGATAFWVTAAFFLFAWVYHLLAGPLPEAPQRAAHLVTGLLYGGIGMLALVLLRLRPEDGGMWVVVAMVVTWANDTLAYFFGRFLGRRKLYPAVSPNKTWEGLFGGVLGSVLGLFAARALVFPGLTVADCLLLGITGGFLGPTGDLAESMLKRAYGVKDSGKLVPGHGGVLDRIDALLFNAPLVFLYVQFVRDRLS